MLFRRRRDGANAVEFALVLPVFIILLVGMMEFSWAFFVRSGVVAAVRDGCRSAAVVHPEDDAEGEAVANIEANLLIYNIDCGDDNTACDITTDSVGLSPSEQLECSVSVNYTSVTGLDLVRLPDVIHADALVLYELQR